jgi:hypothetical protein
MMKLYMLCYKPVQVDGTLINDGGRVHIQIRNGYSDIILAEAVYTPETDEIDAFMICEDFDGDVEYRCTDKRECHVMDMIVELMKGEEA